MTHHINTVAAFLTDYPSVVKPDECDGCGFTTRDGLSYSEETELSLCDDCYTVATVWPQLFSDDPDQIDAWRSRAICDIWTGSALLATL